MGTSRSIEVASPWTAGACVLSGRPDPVWELPDDVAQPLVHIWDALETIVGVMAVPPGLGYRGCWLRDPQGRRWHAFDGSVRLSAPEGESLRADPGRTFERTLIASAPARLPVRLPGLL